MLRFSWIALVAAFPGTALGQTCWLDDADLAAGELECNRTYNIGSDCLLSDASSYGACGSGYLGDDLSYSIRPPAGQMVFAQFSYLHDPLMDVDLIVTEDDNCGTGASCIASVDGDLNDYQLSDGSTITLAEGGTDFFQSSGNTYYVTIDERLDQVCDFYDYDVSVTIGCTEACDPDVDVSRPISCSTDIPGTTASARNTLDAYVCGEPYGHLPQPNPERIYSFVPQTTGKVVFKLDNMTTDQDLYVLENSCDPSSCIASSTRASVDTDEVEFDAEAGRSYYIVVESFGGAGSYDLSFDDVAGGCNEDCDDGIDNDLDGLKDCDDEDDCADDAVCECDADGDGQEATGTRCGGTDCDDVDPAVYLGATETCDGKDNNCNGNIDENAGTTWYADTDGDAVGNTAAPLRACTQPSGYVQTNGDCDDTNPSIRPGATELCNGLNDDCDGEIDEDVTNQSWYADADRDGYGAGDATDDCKAPSPSHVTNDDDCDDSSDAVYPGAAEQCDDIDHDCDGQTNNDVTRQEWYLDADQDGFGGGDAVLDCAQPSPNHLPRGGDCIDSDPAINPAATEACNGYDDNCDGLVDAGCDEDTGLPDTDTDTDTDTGDEPLSFDSAGAGTIQGGCGCNTANPTGAASLFGLLALLGLRRRRSA